MSSPRSAKRHAKISPRRLPPLGADAAKIPQEIKLAYAFVVHTLPSGFPAPQTSAQWQVIKQHPEIRALVRGGHVIYPEQIIPEVAAIVAGVAELKQAGQLTVSADDYAVFATNQVYRARQLQEELFLALMGDTAVHDIRTFRLFALPDKQRFAYIDEMIIWD